MVEYHVTKNQAEATHVRIPAKTWASALQVLGRQPYEQVASILQSLFATTELLKVQEESEDD